jgi:mitochondrial chaperone BCS1
MTNLGPKNRIGFGIHGDLAALSDARLALFQRERFHTTSNEAYDMLLAWVSCQPFAQQASSIFVRSGRRRGVSVDDHSDEMQKKALSYSPYSGSFLFWYKNHPLVFHSVKNGCYWDEEVSVTCIGRTPGVLKDLLSTCRADYLKFVE